MSRQSPRRSSRRSRIARHRFSPTPARSGSIPTSPPIRFRPGPGARSSRGCRCRRRPRPPPAVHRWGHDDVMQAIAANLAEVGINLAIETTELSDLQWDLAGSRLGRAAVRHLASGLRPAHAALPDVRSTGPLSRFADDEADRLIADAAREPILTPGPPVSGPRQADPGVSTSGLSLEPDRRLRRARFRRWMVSAQRRVRHSYPKESIR